MTRTLLVVPTGRRVGLTSTCLGLVTALDRAGFDVGYLKPIGQPGRSGGDHSTALVRLLTRLDPPDPVPAARAATLLGAGRADELMELVVELVEPMDDRAVVVVEGLVPSTEHVWSTRLNALLAGALDADVLLVADGASSSAEDIAIAAAPYRSGDRLPVAGCVLSRLPGPAPTAPAGGTPDADDTTAACGARDADDATAACGAPDVDDATAAAEAVRARMASALDRHGIALAGAVPYRPELTWPRTADVALALGARTLVAGDTGRRVSDVLVCAQSVPGLLPLLHDGALLLVPGDRHDVVMAACLAAMNGVRLAGLLLTAGVEPDPEVLRLTAATPGLPILVVDELTYPTAVRVHELDPELSPADPDRVRAVAGAVADALDPAWVHDLPDRHRPRRLTPAAFRHRLVESARAADARIVLPEGAEPRTVQAALVCAERGIARPVLLCPPDALDATLRTLGRTLPASVEVLDPAAIADRYVDRLVSLRAHKGMTPAVAQERLGDPITVGTMMLAAGEVDGLVAGAVHTTAATVRPALELIRVAPDARLVSSVFFMLLRDEVVAYADCAINPDPTAEELADIAVQTATSAAALGIDPRIAMISFSTGSSGSGADVEKVARATEIVRDRRPDLAVDGPLQYDAAAVTSVAASKRPDSPVAGQATVFVFPDLNTGNTTYKAVQRSADVVSIGPMLQGLARPVNDLSRGALVEDIVYTIALTAIQAG